MYCNTNYFPVLPFCGPYSKPRGARVFSKHYHLRFYPKIGNGVCAIRHIPCALRIIIKINSLIRENTKKYSVKENGQTEIIIFRIILMLHTNM